MQVSSIALLCSFCDCNKFAIGDRHVPQSPWAALMSSCTCDADISIDHDEGNSRVQHGHMVAIVMIVLVRMAKVGGRLTPY